MKEEVIEDVTAIHSRTQHDDKDGDINEDHEAETVVLIDR